MNTKSPEEIATFYAFVLGCLSGGALSVLAIILAR